MGKTSQPLVIWVDQDWWLAPTKPEVLALEAQGHKVFPIAAGQDFEGLTPDLILSRAAWHWTSECWPHIDVAIKAARKRKREAK